MGALKCETLICETLIGKAKKYLIFSLHGNAKTASLTIASIYRLHFLMLCIRIPARI